MRAHSPSPALPSGQSPKERVTRPASTQGLAAALALTCLAPACGPAPDGRNGPRFEPPPAEPLAVAVLPADLADAQAMEAPHGGGHSGETEIGSLAIDGTATKGLHGPIAIDVVLVRDSALLAEFEDLSPDEWRLQKARWTEAGTQELRHLSFEIPPGTSIPELFLSDSGGALAGFVFAYYSVDRSYKTRVEGAGVLQITLRPGGLDANVAQ